MIMGMLTASVHAVAMQTASRHCSGVSFRNGIRFGEMIGDIGRWLLVGVLIAGVIAAVLPDDA